MFQTDPILEAERKARELHDTAGKYTQPVLKRYPLLFAFLLVFSFAAILHGFELLADQFEIINTHPTLLILIGAVVLFLTGRLYKSLK